MHVIYIPISSIYSGILEDIIEKKLNIYKRTKIQKVDNYSSLMAITNPSLSSSTMFDLITQDKIRLFSDKMKQIDSIQTIWRRNEDEFLVRSWEKKQGLFVVNIYLGTIRFKALVHEDEEILSTVFFDKCFVLKVQSSKIKSSICFLKWFN